MIEQTMTKLIHPNNITSHCTIAVTKDAYINFVYGQLIKNTPYNPLNKIRSEFIQEDDFTTNKSMWLNIKILVNSCGYK